MAEARIFISMGTPYTEAYSRFRVALESFLRVQCRANPRIIGVNEYPVGNPLTKIREVMKGCHGVLIVAYERNYLQSGIEKRSGDKPTQLSDRTYTTSWNHIESAMAFSLGLPIYIICENGLTEEGLIESKNDWYVQHMDMTPEALTRPDISESLRAWVSERVAPAARKWRVLRSLEGSLRLSEMTPKEIWGTFALLAAIFAAGAAFGRWLPASFGS